MRFQQIDGVGNDAQCAAIAEEMSELLVPRAVNWKHDTHVAPYAPLPALLYDLGLRTPDGRVHFTLLPKGCQVALHAHDWPAFVWFPAEHPISMFHFDRTLKTEVVPGRLVLLPTNFSHWVPTNLYDEPRLAIASEITPESRFYE